MRTIIFTFFIFMATYTFADDIRFNDGNVHNIDYAITEVFCDNIIIENDPNTNNTTTVNLLPGCSLSCSLEAYDDSLTTFSGGTVGGSLQLFDYSTVQITGGTITYQLIVHNNSQAYILGGTTSEYIIVSDSVNVTISGGTIGFGIRASGNAVIVVQGVDFKIDGLPVGYGNILSVNSGSYASEPTKNLSGVLASGEAKNFNFWLGDNTKIILEPPPPYELTMMVEPNDIGINNVIPEIGTSNFSGEVVLSVWDYANCPQVYTFDYWQGDVIDPNSATTTIFMDSNKTVTAVFVDDRQCGDECHPDNLLGDFDNNCIIDLVDFSQFALNFMACTKPECD